MIIHDVPQLSDSWWELRQGVPTASEFHRIITAKDGLPSKSQEAYATELAKDLQCQNPPYFSNGGKPVNVHMNRGRNLEDEAIAALSLLRKIHTRKVGFVTTDDGRFGCSPDSLFETQDGKWLGGIEVKCPSVDKHEANVKRGTLPMTYKAQCHGGLVVTGLPSWIFIEYCPDSKTPTLMIEVKPDDFTEKLKAELDRFWELYQSVKAKLGVGMPEVDPKVTKAIQAWKEKLAEGPGIATLNEWLEEAKDLPQAAKLPCWEMVKAYGATKGWVFDYALKTWLRPA